MDLFTLTGITVTSAMGSAPRFLLAGPDDRPLGEAVLSGVSLDGRLRRWFGNPAEYPFSLAVRDTEGTAANGTGGTGNTVLTVDKERQGRFGSFFDAVVRLADDREIGRVRRRWPLSGHVTFLGEADAEIATAPAGRYTAPFDVTPAGGTAPWAGVEVDLVPDSARRYALRFAPDAPVRVRALTLGYVLARDAQLFPRGHAF